MRRGIAGALLVLSTAGCAPSLAAPPHLIASWPTAGATLSLSSHILELTFNRDLDQKGTWATVRAEDGSSVRTATTVDPSDDRRLTVKMLDPVAGDFHLYWHAVATDSGLASDGDQPFAMRKESPAPPRIDVSPANADNNERLELVGKGFAPDAPLQLKVGDQAMDLVSTRTDEHGRFNVEARVPAALPYGVQPITAVDASGRTALGSVFMRYGGWPPLVADDVGLAGPDTGEVTFTLSVRNVSDYVLEHVSVQMEDPEGATLVSAEPAADRVGDSVSWLIPEMDRGFAGPYRVTYRADHALVSHAWLEFRHRHERGCSGDQCVPAFISNSVADSSPTAPR